MYKIYTDTNCTDVMGNGADTGPKDLSDDARARWEALKDAVGELAGAAGDSDGFTAAFAAMRQVVQGIDTQEILNVVHVPDDAGEYTDALRRMLARIPDGWGRWISCSRGWYPILADLDQQLAALFPTYEIHQVKEKYGGLRFYWHASGRATDPADPRARRSWTISSTPPSDPPASPVSSAAAPDSYAAQRHAKRGYQTLCLDYAA